MGFVEMDMIQLADWKLTQGGHGVSQQEDSEVYIGLQIFLHEFQADQKIKLHQAQSQTGHGPQNDGMYGD